MGYIGMLLYHYIISEEVGSKPSSDLSKDASNKRNFSKQVLIMPLILFILILTPFLRNHKLR